MDQHQFLRPQRVEIDELFGIYDHRINLNLKDRITLLHGRNGVGKTAVLRMINALLCGNWRIVFRFEDFEAIDVDLIDDH